MDIRIWFVRVLSKLNFRWSQVRAKSSQLDEWSVGEKKARLTVEIADIWSRRSIRIQKCQSRTLFSLIESSFKALLLGDRRGWINFHKTLKTWNFRYKNYLEIKILMKENALNLKASQPAAKYMTWKSNQTFYQKSSKSVHSIPRYPHTNT